MLKELGNPGTIEWDDGGKIGIKINNSNFKTVATAVDECREESLLCP